MSCIKLHSSQVEIKKQPFRKDGYMKQFIYFYRTRQKPINAARALTGETMTVLEQRIEENMAAPVQLARISLLLAGMGIQESLFSVLSFNLQKRHSVPSGVHSSQVFILLHSLLHTLTSCSSLEQFALHVKAPLLLHIVHLGSRLHEAQSCP